MREAASNRMLMRTAHRLLEAPRFGLGQWPTPIDTIACARGPAVLVKRDDLSAWGRGGAKARKIENLIGHLKARGNDELVTLAGNITNLAFDLISALDLAGIRASLFILDDPPARPEDREEIFHGVRDRVTLLGPSRLGAARALAERWLVSRRAGRRPFLALPGVSHPSGVVGNARGFIEMVLQRSEQRLPVPRTVFVTAATGTTVAGFLLGEHALREAGFPPIRVVGVQVYPGAMRCSVHGLLRWTARHLRLQTLVPNERIKIVSTELYGGFGRYPEALAERCRKVGADTGLELDPIFGGKTWTAMDRFIAREAPPDESVLFWHCGFTPEWSKLGRVTPRGRRPL